MKYLFLNVQSISHSRQNNERKHEIETVKLTYYPTSLQATCSLFHAHPYTIVISPYLSGSAYRSRGPTRPWRIYSGLTGPRSGWDLLFILKRLGQGYSKICWLGPNSLKWGWVVWSLNVSGWWNRWRVVERPLLWLLPAAHLRWHPLAGGATWCRHRSYPPTSRYTSKECFQVSLRLKPSWLHISRPSAASSWLCHRSSSGASLR